MNPFIISTLQYKIEFTWTRRNLEKNKQSIMKNGKDEKRTFLIVMSAFVS